MSNCTKFLFLTLVLTVEAILDIVYKDLFKESLVKFFLHFIKDFLRSVLLKD